MAQTDIAQTQSNPALPEKWRPDWGRHVETIVSPVLFTIGVFVVWEVVCRVFSVPEAILPTASATFKALWEFRGVLWDNAIVTLWTTLVGFALAIVVGLLLGVAVGWHRAVYSAVYPVLIAFNSIPKVAVVPVLILWFGLGTVPAILTAFLISFFPIVVNVATGLATVEPELEDVLRALGAKKFEVMRKVGVPRSLPHFFGSLKIAITLAFIGAVVAETSGASVGLGKLMLDAQAAFQVPIIFAALLVLSALGILLYAITALIEQRYTGWAHRSQTR
ncbi:ABC transporter permease [Pseudaminobacter sp. NGMCC 1.201702]|uniref:ABC transporter permease n=1 Tax=Pseudaminobacter sp. NGMCC 1.201702 TaxID=3391825 RepID=UPI0039F06060